MEISFAEKVQILKLALSFLNEDVIITDIDGNVKYINKGSLVINPEERLFNIFDFLDSNDQKEIKQALVKHQKWCGEVFVKSQDKERSKKFLKAISVAVDDGRTFCYLFVFSDTCFNSGLQKKLQQASKMVSLGSIAAGVIHDLNNLLSPILAYSEILLQEISSEDLIYKRLKIINEAAYQARELITQLLSFTRSKGFSFIPLQLSQVVIKAFNFIRNFISPQIEMDLSLNSRGFIMADPIQIYQILINLCLNASEAIKDKGKIRVEVEDMDLKEKDGVSKYIKLAVSDTGMGMDEQIRENIFSPFFTTKEHGIGLGLFVVYEIVKMLGGKITTYSKLGQGTTFDILLPRVDKNLSIPK